MFVNLSMARQRYDHCKKCEFFNADLKICKKCGCLMPIKVTIGASGCPIGLWLPEKSEAKKRDYNIDD